jgi:hypothetical protein
MSNALTKDDMARLKEASEMFNETGCVPGIDGEQVPAERIVPDVKEYISEMIDEPEAIYCKIWYLISRTVSEGRRASRRHR